MGVQQQAVRPAVVTIDFHVTAECNQDRPYCWGPKGEDPPVDTATAIRIVEHAKEVGARRIVFTGGDPARHTGAAARSWRSTIWPPR